MAVVEQDAWLVRLRDIPALAAALPGTKNTPSGLPNVSSAADGPSLCAHCCRCVCNRLYLATCATAGDAECFTDIPESHPRPAPSAATRGLPCCHSRLTPQAVLVCVSTTVGGPFVPVFLVIAGPSLVHLLSPAGACLTHVGSIRRTSFICRLFAPGTWPMSYRLITGLSQRRPRIQGQSRHSSPRYLRG